MKPIFAPALWCIFLQRMLNVLYPVNVAVLFFLVYLTLEPAFSSFVLRVSNKRLPVLCDSAGTPLRVTVFNLLRKPKALPLLLSIIFCDLLTRMIPFFAGIPFSHRYLYPFALMSTLFAAIGLTAFSDGLQRFLTTKVPSFSKKKLLIAILLVVVAAYSGKSLMPRLDKKWLRDIPEVIRRSTPEGSKPVLFTNYLDTRFAYYSGAKLVQCFPKENFRMLIYTFRKNRNNFAWWNAPKRSPNFKQRVEKLGERAFLLVRRKRNEQDSLTVDVLTFMSRVGEYSDRKRKWTFTLYQGKVSGKSKSGKKS
ncbi:MAG: hypothetical protein GXP32_10375 [Kiritimatiellaeota bacterium]|nr:hypothetical protein [Kiritimatiellota bacterium]